LPRIAWGQNLADRDGSGRWHGFRGGEIRVTVSVGEPGTFTFAVSDTGVGIAPEDLALIFQEFAQVDNARQRYVKGTGLGLSLSRRIAQLLKGRIGVRSELGCGSTFWIAISREHPLARPDFPETLLENVPIPESPDG
jgi:signal transduction histidine kinase